MLLLFRFLELDAGTIFIDGLDIAKLKLSELRQTIAILPQEPILFGGSVRENLDPFEEHLVRTHKRMLRESASCVEGIACQREPTVLGKQRFVRIAKTVWTANIRRPAKASMNSTRAVTCVSVRPNSLTK